MDVRQEPTARQYRQVLGFVRRRVGSAEAAEDVVQEVFVSMAEALARSEKAAPRTLGWLYAVARRRIADEARRRRRGEAVALELVAEPEARADEYGPSVAHTFDAALATLTDDQRRVVLLRLVQGRSFAEIATRLGTTEDACRMRFMRGLERLRAEFEKGGLNP